VTRARAPRVRRSGWQARALLLTAALLAIAIPALLATTAGRGSAPAEASGGDQTKAEAGERGGADGQRPRGAADADDAGTSVMGAASDADGGGGAGAPTRPLARVGALQVRAPSSDPVLVGFHQAATTHGLTMQPVGRLLEDRNPVGRAPPADRPAGTPYLVLDPRGEPTAATSAVDVVLRDDDPVLAPVTGWVSDVRDVVLYGTYPDQRVEVVPRSAPHLRVVLIHVDGVAVAPGDAVVVGRTVLATTARRFPFASQIDRDTDPEVWPHVHLEVQPRRAPRPGDALEAAQVRTPGDAAVDAALTARDRAVEPPRS
jgi:hypothetical protein